MDAVLRVIVANDERLARLFLISLLEQIAGVTVVGAAASGDDALALIEREQPDLVLLDINMPGLDGFGVVHLLESAVAPLVAFVTAFDEYGDLAKEMGPVDYLLKPITIAQLQETIARARDLLEPESA